MALTDIILIYFKRFLKVSSLLFIILTLLSSKAFAGVTFIDSFRVDFQETWPNGLAFNNDGTKMFVMGTDGDDVNEYTLSTGFDVSTASFVDSFSVGSQESSAFGLAFSADGTKMFVTGSGGDDVNEYTLSTGFDVSTASFNDINGDGTGFDVSSQEASPTGLAFNNDGTKMFVLGATGQDVDEYTLSTGFDVSTASFVDRFDVKSQDTQPSGLAFNTDGTKMFVMGGSFRGQDVDEYTLSTGFDVSTASFNDINDDGTGFDVSSQDTQPYGLAFNNDGTKMFVTGGGDDVNEYTLSTGFDLSSTVTFVDSFDYSSQETSPSGLTFSNDGTKMFVTGSDGDDINVYTLSTGFDVSTASFVDSFDVSSQETNPRDVVFNNDGTKMFVMGGNFRAWVSGDDVHEYTLSTGFEITGPTLSSSSPSDGATSVGVNDNIVLTFSEAVDAESGNIVIKKSSDDSTVETIDVTGGLVSGSGSTTITINPSTTLDGETDYYITIAATAFDDADSASYVGFTASTTLNFTTESSTSSTTDPLTDKDVVGSIEAQAEAPKRILQHVRTPVLNRMDWLRRHRKESNLTNQNIKFQFSNAMLASLSKVIPVAAKVNEVSKLSDNWSFWSEGSISVGKIGDTSSSSSKDIDSNGITIGMDKKIDENKMYGYALRFGRDEVEVGTSGTSLDTNSYSLSLYGTFPHEDTKFIDTVLGVSSLKTDHVRKSGANTLTGERSGRQVFGSINFRTTYNKDKFNITPNGRIDLGYTELSEYSEIGTDALIYDKQQIETGMVSIGIRLDDTIQFESITFKPSGLLEYGANFSPSSNATVSYVSDPNTDYTLSVAKEATHNLRAGLGFDFITENGVNIMTNYERNESDNAHSDTLYLGASYLANKETEFTLAMHDTASINVAVIKNIAWVDLKVSLDYDLSSTRPN